MSTKADQAQLRRLKLSRILDILPERLTLARQQKIPHQDFVAQVLSDEVTRRESLAVTLRVQNARLDPRMRFENWDTAAKVTFDRALLNELATLSGDRRRAPAGSALDRSRRRKCGQESDD